MLTLVPAYGRDYKTKAEVLAAWEEGKDFTVNSIGNPHDGRKINKQDAEIFLKGETVGIRYKKLSLQAMIKIKP